MRVGKIGREVSIERGLVLLHRENTPPPLVMDHLHELRVGMQGISGRDRSGDGERRQHRFGHRNLIRFLAHAHLPERFLAVMGTKRQQVRSILL